MDDFSIELPGDLVIMAGTQQLNGKEVDVFDDNSKSLNNIVTGGQVLTRISNFRKITRRVSPSYQTKKLKQLYRWNENVSFSDSPDIVERTPQTTIMYGDGESFHPHMVSDIIVNNSRDLASLIGRIVYPIYTILILDNMVDITNNSPTSIRFFENGNGSFNSSYIVQLGKLTDNAKKLGDIYISKNQLETSSVHGSFREIRLPDSIVLMRDFAFLKHKRTGEYIEDWKNLSNSIAFTTHQRGVVLSETPVSNVRPMKIIAAVPDLSSVVTNGAGMLHLIVNDYGCISSTSNYADVSSSTGLKGLSRISLKVVEDSE